MTKAGWSRESTLAIFIGNKYIVDVSDPFQDTVLVFQQGPFFGCCCTQVCSAQVIFVKALYLRYDVLCVTILLPY